MKEQKGGVGLLFDAKNGKIKIENADMDYIVFGHGTFEEAKDFSSRVLEFLHK